jgi:micrococcal nuclease
MCGRAGRAPRRLLLLLALLALTTGWALPAESCSAPHKPAGLPSATVVRVSDGDTVRLRFPDGHEVRTRLIGIDTPETHGGAKLERDTQRSGQDKATIQALGREATAATRRLLPTGTRVETESDVVKRDRYGRKLAYVWLPDGRMLNVEIMREGYAQTLTVPPNVRYERLL